MPMYEYICKKCSHSFELLISGNQVAKCPECNSKRLEKCLSKFSAGGKDFSVSSEYEPSKNSCSSCGTHMVKGPLPE